MSRLSIVYAWDADYPWDVRTEKIALALTEAGHHVTIVARNRAWKDTREILKEGAVRRMNPWRVIGRKADGLLSFPAFFNPRWVNLMTSTCREVRADLIIVRDIPLTPTALWAGRRLGIPVLLDMAENYPAMMRALWDTGRHSVLDYAVRNPSLTARVERMSVRHVDHVIVVVEESAERVKTLGVPVDRITVVSNTPPLDRLGTYTDRQMAQRSDIEVVYMGNLEVVRGLVESMDAIAILKARGRHVRLRVIGRGRDEAVIRQRAADQGLTDRDVEFLGYVESHADALRIVSQSDVGLMPHRRNDSWNTTIPNKMFDYMAAGIPVVSSDADPCARILRATGAGCVFPSGNAVGIADAITDAAAPGARDSLGMAGRAAIRETYNWEHDTRVLLKAVAATAGKGRPN